MKYILDTCFWYAALDQKDLFHSEAKKIIELQPQLIVPFPVFEELSALVHHRENKKTTLQAVGKLLSSSLVHIRYITEIENREIWEYYQKTPGQIDYVDCSVIWLAQKLQLPVLTFDEPLKRILKKISL
jgi:predicted nucleic acid-binding protein